MSNDEKTKVAMPEPGVAEKVPSEEESHAMEWDDKDESRIRRRMDWRLVPTVFGLYLMCFIDRQVTPQEDAAASLTCPRSNIG